MIKANQTIRERAKQAGVFLWEIAERYGVADTNFSKKLRRELPPEQQNEILRIIDELASGKGEA